MEHILEYLQNADECLTMAKKARNRILREQFVELAHQWSRLAAARDHVLGRNQNKPN